MKCSLCKNPITNYNSTLNHFIIDEKNSADICQNCTDKFVKWQSSIYAKLFPTKTLKKMHNK